MEKQGHAHSPISTLTDMPLAPCPASTPTLPLRLPQLHVPGGGLAAPPLVDLDMSDAGHCTVKKLAVEARDGPSEREGPQKAGAALGTTIPEGMVRWIAFPQNPETIFLTR